jgi:hypothetical protein
MRTLHWILVCLCGIAVAGCAPKVDLTQKLEVVDVHTGWDDMGVVDGQNKIVPSIRFKFKNNSDQTLSTLQANVLFKRVGEETEWGSGFVRVVGSEGLPPGQTSGAQSVSCPKGYTGIQPRAEIMASSLFVDARVILFAKYGSTGWEKLGEFTVDRRLLD